jgi:hypothetical protein
VTSPRTYDKQEIKPLRPSPTLRTRTTTTTTLLLHRSFLLALLLLLSKFELVALLPADDDFPNEQGGSLPCVAGRKAASDYLRRLRQAQNGERKTGYSSPSVSPSIFSFRDEGGRFQLTAVTATGLASSGVDKPSSR